MKVVDYVCPMGQHMENKGTYSKVTTTGFIKTLTKYEAKKGIKKRKQRCHDVEPVFASIKHNHGFKRFMLPGKQKVNIETGLLAMAHNLRKKAFQIIKKAA